jgi:hypothetical protein
MKVDRFPPSRPEEGTTTHPPVRRSGRRGGPITAVSIACYTKRCVASSSDAKSHRGGLLPLASRTELTGRERVTQKSHASCEHIHSDLCSLPIFFPPFISHDRGREAAHQV